MFGYLDNVVKYNQPLAITLKDNSVVVLSEDDYRGIMETLYLHSIPNLVNELIESKKTPQNELVEIDWRKELGTI
jgi:PHD/YefM family antitoxin component YafN of YafNO toxin-antitoxin module